MRRRGLVWCACQCGLILRPEFVRQCEWGTQLDAGAAATAASAGVPSRPTLPWRVTSRCRCGRRGASSPSIKGLSHSLGPLAPGASGASGMRTVASSPIFTSTTAAPSCPVARMAARITAVDFGDAHAAALPLAGAHDLPRPSAINLQFALQRLRLADPNRWRSSPRSICFNVARTLPVLRASGLASSRSSDMASSSALSRGPSPSPCPDSPPPTPCAWRWQRPSGPFPDSLSTSYSISDTVDRYYPPSSVSSTVNEARTSRRPFWN